MASVESRDADHPAMATGSDTFRTRGDVSMTGADFRDDDEERTTSDLNFDATFLSFDARGLTSPAVSLAFFSGFVLEPKKRSAAPESTTVGGAARGDTSSDIEAVDLRTGMARGDAAAVARGDATAPAAAVAASWRGVVASDGDEDECDRRWRGDNSSNARLTAAATGIVGSDTG